MAEAEAEGFRSVNKPKMDKLVEVQLERLSLTPDSTQSEHSDKADMMDYDQDAVAVRQQGQVQAQMLQTSVSADDAEQDEGFTDKFNEVFGVEMIFGQIVSYLSGSDLKALRAVSPLTFSMIRECSKFRDNMKLKVTMENSDKLFETAVESSWKNLEFDVEGWIRIGGSDRDHNCIRRMLLPATQLKLFSGDSVVHPETKYIQDSILNQFLSNSPQLRSLIVDFGVIKLDLSSVLENEEVKSQFARLRKLCFTNRDNVNVRINRQIQQSMYGNLRLFDEALTPLTEFELEGIHFDSSFTFEPASETLYQVICRILRKSCESLQSLTLKGDINELVDLSKMTFSLLKQLSVDARMELGSPFPILDPFLKAQPLLENLNLKFSYGLAVDFLDVVRAKSASLKVLSITSSNLYSRTDPAIPDMSFLKNVAGLEELSVYQEDYCIPLEPTWVRGGQQDLFVQRLTAANLIPHLPPTLKKLELTGTYGFGPGSPGLPDDPNAFGEDYLPEEGLPWNWNNPLDNTLGGLPNLTHLSLLGCYNGLSDHILQSLFEKGQLTVLEFSHCEYVTDACLNRAHGYTFGLTDLKGLRKLSIFDCSHISEEGLVSSVRFQELQYLTLWLPAAKVMSNEGLSQIGSSNPSLEYLSTRPSLSESDSDLEIRMKEICPRMSLIDYKVPASCLDWQRFRAGDGWFEFGHSISGFDSDVESFAFSEYDGVDYYDGFFQDDDFV